MPMNKRDEFDDPKGNDLLGSIGPKAAFFIVLIALSFMIGVVWKLYVGGGSSDGQNVPIVRADTTPYKVEPDDPGGMEMPHKDSTIFSSLNSDPDADKGIENLLAEDEGEEPVPRSQLFAGLNTERNPDLHAEAQETPLDKPLNEGDERIISQAKEAKAIVTNLVEDGADAISIEGGVEQAVAEKAIEVPKKVEPISSDATELVEKEVKSEELEQAEIKAEKEIEAQQQIDAAEAKKKADAEKAIADKKEKESLAAEAKNKADAAKVIADQKAKEKTAVDAKKKADDAKVAAVKKAKEKAAAAKAVVENSVEMVGDYYVQLASVQDSTRTESEWIKLKKKYGAALLGYSYRVETANLAKGTYYRIQAGPVSKAQANTTCNAIKRKSSNGCIVKKK